MSNVVPMIANDESSRYTAVWNTALTVFLKKEIALEAVCVLEEYAMNSVKQNNTGAIAITKILADYFDWGQQDRHNFRLSLARNLMPGAELDPIPSKELAAFRANFTADFGSKLQVPPGNCAANQQAASPEFVVFYTVLGAIRQIINARYGEHSEDFVLSLGEEMDAINADSAWKEWAETLVREGKVRKMKPFPNHQKMAEIVQTFYNAVADAVGPVDADKVLSEAVAKTEKISAAASYSPKNFL